MFIIPAERGIDWRRAPVVTGALILLCCLVFFAWQWNDDQRLHAAADFYTEQNLLALELPVFISHISQTRGPELADQFRELDVEKFHDQLTLSVLSDYSFTATLEETNEAFWGDDVYSSWRGKRDELNLLLNEISPFRLGLIPSESRPITYLTYQFMHGDVMHLLGNMVILALTGVAVEAAIGSLSFLVAYVLCGIVAGVFFTLFNLQSFTPLVGASGSISGVMGMYVALYGMRKIRFFYSVIVYFGYFTAPALVILPVWVAWEVYNAVWGGVSNVAYIAHAGGLIAGGLGMYFARPWLLQVEETYLDHLPDEDLEFRTDLDDFLKQLAAFNFESAKRKLSALEARYPDHVRLLEQRYYLEKLNDTPSFHQFTHQLFARNQRDEVFLYMLLDVYKDYAPNLKQHPLDSSTLIKLMLNFSQLEAWETVQDLLKQAQAQKLRDPMLVKIMRVLAKGVRENGESHLGQKFSDMADSLEQSLAQ